MSGGGEVADKVSYPSLEGQRTMSSTKRAFLGAFVAIMAVFFIAAFLLIGVILFEAREMMPWWAWIILALSAALGVWIPLHDKRDMSHTAKEH